RVRKHRSRQQDQARSTRRSWPGRCCLTDLYDHTGSSSRPLQLGLLALSPPTSQDHSCTTLCPEQLSYAICRLTGFLLALSPPTSQDHSCTTLCPEQLSYAICRLTGFLSSLILLPFEGDALRRILIVLVLVGATVPLS